MYFGKIRSSGGYACFEGLMTDWGLGVAGGVQKHRGEDGTDELEAGL